MKQFVCAQLGPLLKRRRLAAGWAGAGGPRDGALVLHRWMGGRRRPERRGSRPAPLDGRAQEARETGLSSCTAGWAGAGGPRDGALVLHRWMGGRRRPERRGSRPALLDGRAQEARETGLSSCTTGWAGAGGPRDGALVLHRWMGGRRRPERRGSRPTPLDGRGQEALFVTNGDTNAITHPC